jgi:hypothetical protein
MLTTERMEKTDEPQHLDTDRQPDPSPTDGHREEVMARLRHRFKLE